MRHKKKTDLHVVKNTEDVTDAYINQVLEQVRREDGIYDGEGQQKKVKKSHKLRFVVFAVCLALGMAAAFVVISLQTYTSARVTVTYELGDSGNVNYQEFAGGVLRYSKDGIALVDRKGDEIWNYPYQIKNPVIDTYANKAVVVADKGGNAIVVLDRNGLKGEMQTTLPVERAVVSAQGIVCAVLKEESSPKIICYDAAGNILVEITTSLTGTGYPLDVGISEDGKLLLVSYLCVKNGQLVTKVKYYNFEGEKSSSKDFEVVSEEYVNLLAASAFFVDEDTSVVVGNDRLLFYKGKEQPKLTETVMLNKKIKSVFHNSRYVGLILKNEGKAGYELCLFDDSGNKLLSQDFMGDYSNVKLSGSQILMYDGKKCRVYTRTGICKFVGELDSNILEIYPVLGVNKYVVINADGMDIVRFVK